MKKLPFFLVAVLFLTFVSVLSIGAEDVEENNIAYIMDTPPTFDGYISESEWGSVSFVVDAWSALPTSSTENHTRFIYTKDSSLNDYSSWTYKAWLKHDNSYLYIGVKLNDPNGHYNNGIGTNLSNGDALRFVINAEAAHSFTFAYVKDFGGYCMAWDDTHAENALGCKVAISPAGSAYTHDTLNGITTYEIAIPWSALNLEPLNSDYRFSLIAFDKGIGVGKDYDAFLAYGTKSLTNCSFNTAFVLSNEPFKQQQYYTKYDITQIIGNNDGIIVVDNKYTVKVPTGLKLSENHNLSQIISWDAVNGASGYLLYNKTLDKYYYSTTNSVQVKGLSAATTYRYCVKAYLDYNSERIFGLPSSYKTLSTTPANPTVTSTSANSSITFSWKAVNGVAGYALYDSNKKYIGVTTKLSYNVSGLSVGKKYTYYIRSYRTVDGTTYYSPYVEMSAVTKSAFPNAPSGLKLTETHNLSLKLGWNALSGSSGYLVYNKTTDKYYFTTSNSINITGLTAGTTYKFCVKAYKLNGSQKVYGSASAYLTVSTTPKDPQAKTHVSSSNAITLNFSGVNGATGYAIYDSNKKYIGVVSSLSYKATSLSPGKNYVYYVRAYRNVDGKNYYSNYVKLSAATTPAFVQSTETVYVSTSYQFKVASTASVTWKSSDTTLATVSSSGVVTGRKAGNVVISAVTNGKIISKTVKITKSTPKYALYTKTVKVPNLGEIVHEKQYGDRTYSTTYNASTGLVTDTYTYYYVNADKSGVTSYLNLLRGDGFTQKSYVTSKNGYTYTYEKNNFEEYNNITVKVGVENDKYKITIKISY